VDMESIEDQLIRRPCKHKGQEGLADQEPRWHGEQGGSAEQETTCTADAERIS
jgi:hypothetical protein